MFKHVLVTLDGSPRAEAVMPHAIDLAKTMGAEVTLLRVVDSASSDRSERGAISKGQAPTMITSLFVEQATAYLSRIAADVRQHGISAHVLVKQGVAAKQIIATAKEGDVDAIAMATHSRRGINRMMFGSVAEEVLHDSELPVLLVRAA